MEKITITRRGEIITAKSGSKYFMLEDETQRELICFVPELHEHLEVGTGVDVDIAPPRKEGGTPSITQVYVDGKPLVEAQTKQPFNKGKGSSDASIESQVAFKGLIELCVADRLKVNDPVIISAIAWAVMKMGGKYEALQVHKEITTATKSPIGETVVTNETGQEAVGGSIDLEWLQASLKKLKWTGVTAWMKAQYNISEGMTVREVLDFMSEPQKMEFVKEVKGRLAAIEAMRIK